MPLHDSAFWAERVRQILRRYEEPLLRAIAGKLFKPRSQWPAEELIERAVATLDNAPVIDRRLHGLDIASRRLLALMGHSRLPRWKLGHLLELLACLGHSDGMQPAFALFEEGLLYPDLPDHGPTLLSFELWLHQAAAVEFAVIAHPLVGARAVGEDLGLPECLATTPESTAVHEADGLDWPLRLAVLWQQVAAGPLRLTQQGDLFKRDWDRLRSEPLLNGSAGETTVDIPDAGPLTLTLARIEGLLQEASGELRAGPLPATWGRGLHSTLESLWAALPLVENWNPEDGADGAPSGGNPFISANLLALLLLARLPQSKWARATEIEQWLFRHHPHWQGNAARHRVKGHKEGQLRSGIATFLLGLAYQLNLVQAVKDRDGEWFVRLTGIGRWLLGIAERPANRPSYPKTILVQPNLEIVAYRQGLTPGLISSLSLLATWKSLGPACTLQLQPDTVYRALEAGWTFESMLQTLEQYGMRTTPPAVIESLRTWANKRERLSVYPAAALFEFASAEDLDAALARGLPAVRLTERLAVVANEKDIDYRHFRLNGTRDYALPPDQCVDVEADGVTLTIDPVRADLLLETELRRFAELLDRSGANGRRQYQLTPRSLAAARDGEFGLPSLETWFVQRTGRPLTAAAKLLLCAGYLPPVEVRRELVLHLASAELADGLLQWPATRTLIRARLGPTVLAVAETDLQALREQLAGLGITIAANTHQVPHGSS
jgi:hypothetical protein